MPGAPPSRQNADPRPVKGTGPGRQDLPRARRADGIRVHLLGAAERGGHLLDHLEVGVKHNETGRFTQLLEPLDLDGAVVTFDALHTVRASLAWLGTGKKAHYIAMLEQLFLHGVLVEHRRSCTSGG